MANDKQDLQQVLKYRSFYVLLVTTEGTENTEKREYKCNAIIRRKMGQLYFFIRSSHIFLDLLSTSAMVLNHGEHGVIVKTPVIFLRVLGVLRGFIKF